MNYTTLRPVPPSLWANAWADMKSQYVNTLLVSVIWEMIDSHEGEFDFSELDRVLAGTREHGIHLILLDICMYDAHAFDFFDLYIYTTVQQLVGIMPSKRTRY